MRRILLVSVGLTAIATRSLFASTFAPARIAPEWGLDALTRAVARQHVGRELFSDPYATVSVGHVDVYDVFPYVESRTFQVVSDPRWNRLVYGELGQSLAAYDGRGQALGALASPHGMSVDERDRVYVADTGNDRIVVLQATTEYGDVTLLPRFAITGLSRPYDVSYSDGGTPFVPGDDWLYVADTGKNRVLAYSLGADGARLVASIGDLGGGPGRFAGPMAITAGRANGANTRDVYVADAHTRRIVRLRHDATGLQWVTDVRGDADLVTSLDADPWGNLYAAAPNQARVLKLGADLVPLATLRGDLTRPRSFRVPFATVHDHRSGLVTREGRPSAVSVEDWSDASGVRLWSLGVDVADLAVADGQAPAARFTLTDPARVTLEVLDAASGRTLSRRSIGALPAGARVVPLSGEDLASAEGSDRLLRVTAASSYPGGSSSSATTGFRVQGGAAALPAQAMLLGGMPNPVATSTRIAFVLPRDGGAGAFLGLYDPAGRAVRRFTGPFAPGRNEVLWDGSGDSGKRVAPGVYFARLHTRDRQVTQTLVVTR